MEKSAIINEINTKYQAFASFIEGLSEADFTFSLNGEKWTAGQQTEHLCKSVAPLNKGLMAPEFALKAMFGKAEHDSVTYADLVARYKSELAAGGKAPSDFVPKPVAFDRKGELLGELQAQVAKLCKNIEKYDEAKLDKLVLPHPLLGKLTIREMLYFTMYHAEHHLTHTRNNLASHIEAAG